jgi:hypothetical protein
LRIANDKGCAPVAADRFAQNSLFSELPGVAFAFFTLPYIVRPFGSAAALIYCSGWSGEFAPALMTSEAEGYSDGRHNRT